MPVTGLVTGMFRPAEASPVRASEVWRGEAHCDRWSRWAPEISDLSWGVCFRPVFTRPTVHMNPAGAKPVLGGDEHRGAQGDARRCDDERPMVL